MSPFWPRTLVVGGFVIGIAIVGLLTFNAFAILSGDNGEPEAQVAQRAQTATPTPVVTRTPLATPTPTPPPPTPTQTPEPTPEPESIVEQQPPPPVEEPAPLVEEQPPPPPTQEPPLPPPPTEELPPATQPPSPAPPTEEPPTRSAEEFLMDIMVQFCEGGSLNACLQACEGGVAEACALLEMLSDYSQPSYPAPSSTGGEIVVETCIDGEFEGWEGDTVFELCNGQVWIQASYDYLYHYAYRPDVTIVSTDEGYRMFVEDVSDSILVARVTDFIRTCIDGGFEGWEGETIFVLCNGQVWQQASYDYTYHYAYRPDVLIYRTGSRYRMKVERVRGTIEVIQLQ